MLVLSIKEMESIRIGDDAIITASKVGSLKVDIAIDAPPEILVQRLDRLTDEEPVAACIETDLS